MVSFLSLLAVLPKLLNERKATARTVVRIRSVQLVKSCETQRVVPNGRHKPVEKAGDDLRVVPPGTLLPIVRAVPGEGFYRRETVQHEDQVP